MDVTLAVGSPARSRRRVTWSLLWIGALGAKQGKLTFTDLQTATQYDDAAWSVGGRSVWSPACRST